LIFPVDRLTATSFRRTLLSSILPYEQSLTTTTTTTTANSNNSDDDDDSYLDISTRLRCPMTDHSSPSFHWCCHL